MKFSALPGGIRNYTFLLLWKNVFPPTLLTFFFLKIQPYVFNMQVGD